MTANGHELEICSLSYNKRLPPPNLIYVVDFFCGCGGMSWGFANTRQSHQVFKVLAGIDIDKSSLATYEANLHVPTVNCDIWKIAEDPGCLNWLIPDFNPSNCRPLVFIGCAPCQGFSAHRKKDNRDDKRNTLMMAFAQICKHYKPDVVVMENVPEILAGKYRSYFMAAANTLEREGYSLTMDALDLSLFGVPQKRRRAIVLGSLTDGVTLPSPIFTAKTAPTVRDAIAHLEKLQAGQVSKFDSDHRAPQHTGRILARIKKIPPDGGDRRALSAQEQLACHLTVDNGETPGFTDVYGRLRWDTPSVTITAKSSTPSCGRFLHPEQNRNITVREAAILQGFPHTFKFHGPFSHRYRQIGEAVPPLFARFLAWEVLNYFSSSSDKGYSRVFASPQSCLHQHRVSKPKDSIKVVECFCGAGGMSLGFEAAGYETVFAFDIDADCMHTFNTIAPVAVQADIRNAAVVRMIEKAVKGDTFVLTGGPPCQGFSQQRKGDNNDERNNLVLEYAKLARSLSNKPSAIVLENVTYLDSPRGRQILEEYVRQMNDMEFEVFRHDLNSAEFAIPQLRHRIIVVALPKAVAIYYKPPVSLTPARWVTVGEVLHGLQEPSDNGVDRQLPNHVVSKEGDLNKRRIAFVDMGNGRKAIPTSLQLGCHQRYDGHLDVYGRLDWFSQARTVTGGFDSFTRGEYAHPFHHRSITPREAARLQGFPDWFVFYGNRASIRRQIGNAVPPLMAFSVAKALRRSLRKGNQ